MKAALIPDAANASPRLTSQTAVVVTNGGRRLTTTWGRFVHDNADGMEAGERMAIAAALAAGATYRGGGGAAPEWSIERAVA